MHNPTKPSQLTAKAASEAAQTVMDKMMKDSLGKYIEHQLRAGGATGDNLRKATKTITKWAEKEIARRVNDELLDA